MTESNEKTIDAPDSDDGALLPPETVKVAAVRPPGAATPRVPGTVPMQPIPEEVKAHMRAVGTPGGPATPFESAPQPPAQVNNGGLPFQPAPASPGSGGPPLQPPPVVTPGPVTPGPVTPGPVTPGPVTPHAPAQTQAHHPGPTGPQPKRPPLQLHSPGLLGGTSSFHAHAHLIGAGAAVAAAAPPPAQPVPPHQPPQPGHQPAVQHQAGQHQAGQHQAGQHQAGQHQAGHHQSAPAQPGPAQPAVAPAAGQHAPTPTASDPIPPPVGSNPDGVSGIMPNPAPPTPAGGAAAATSDPPVGAEAIARHDEHALAGTNSPWSAEKRFEADVLPSANVLNSSNPEPPPPPPAVSTGGGGSRTAMTVGLAIAAVALVGTVVYFAVAGRGSAGDDPASVNVGTEQREYGDDPAPSATATAAPAPKPKPKPKWRPKPQPKKKSGGDIYDNL